MLTGKITSSGTACVPGVVMRPVLTSRATGIALGSKRGNAAGRSTSVPGEAAAAARCDFQCLYTARPTPAAPATAAPTRISTSTCFVRKRERILGSSGAAGGGVLARGCRTGAEDKGKAQAGQAHPFLFAKSARLRYDEPTARRSAMMGNPPGRPLGLTDSH